MAIELHIEVETLDANLSSELMGTQAVAGELPIPGNAKLKYSGEDVCKAAGMSRIVYLSLIFSGNVAASLVAAWLYDKLKGKASKITIDRTEVRLDKGEIARIIQEKIKVQH